MNWKMTELKQGWNKARTTKPLETEPLEEGITYKYYIIEDFDPVRVTLSCRGFEIGAETIDPQTGLLKIDNTLLSRIDTGPYVEEVDQDRFEALCKTLCQKKRITSQE